MWKEKEGNKEEGKERIKSEENKKIVGEWKLFFYFRKKVHIFIFIN